VHIQVLDSGQGLVYTECLLRASATALHKVKDMLQDSCLSGFAMVYSAWMTLASRLGVSESGS
jgi:hypothetical protein